MFPQRRKNFLIILALIFILFAPFIKEPRTNQSSSVIELAAQYFFEEEAAPVPPQRELTDADLSIGLSEIIALTDVISSTPLELNGRTGIERLRIILNGEPLDRGVPPLPFTIRYEEDEAGNDVTFIDPDLDIGFLLSHGENRIKIIVTTDQGTVIIKEGIFYKDSRPPQITL